MNVLDNQTGCNSPDRRERNEKKASVENDLQRIIQSPTFKMKQRELTLVEQYQKRKQNILVSIIMPTWNRKFIIKRAIDSVLAQSYQNFQLIISDDGSTDDTGGFINENYGSESRISYIYNKHRGVTYARNSALEIAKGQIVAYLDSDNQWAANYLLVMTNAMEDAHDKSTAYCGLRIINTIRQGRFTRLVTYDRKSLLQRNYIDMNIFMHRKNLFDRYGGFDHDAAPLEDWEFILRYTRDDSPLVVECCLANYYIAKSYNHHSLSKEMDSSYHRIRKQYGN
jgi:glycosyltransferase involved in cell wall biosynthesis